LNILHMGLISDVEVCCWLLVSHWCQAMPISGHHWAESMALCQQIRTKLIPFAALTEIQLM
jgi:hypothetical protein